jgi:signal transduction histidine kinase
MISTFEMASLMEVLSAGLSELAIKGCYISLYEGSGAPAEFSHLILAYDRPERIGVAPDRRRFPSHQLAPGGALPQDRPYSLLVLPLLFGEDQLGFVAFEADAQQAGVCVTLCGQISSSLKGTLLLQTHQQAEKALEQHTLELEARSEELQRQSEELDAFARTVAHDLKGPLGPIVGYADFLGVHLPTLSEEDVRLLLGTMGESAVKMGNIIDELLLLATIRSLEDVEVGPLNMGRIVAESLARLSYGIEEQNAEITLLPDGTWPDALGYGPWIEQVWTNYLSNALKYGGQPPQVEVGADLPILLKGGEGATVRFWVRDNGRGLTPREQEQLFTQFTRLDRVRATGHGLGLSIVRRIVEKLGGRVGVESEIGSGSTFWFTLPAMTTK